MKKSQIRMGETIAVLIIFFFLLVFGAIFYFQVQKSKIYTNNQEQIYQESIKISQGVSYLPELQCSHQNIIDDNCFDLYKLNIAAKHINNNRNFYFPLFGNSNVTIEEIYPSQKKWVIYENVLPSSVAGRIPTYIPISLYNATKRSYSFGVLTVIYYST
jgi:hypothetical protein